MGDSFSPRRAWFGAVRGFHLYQHRLGWLCLWRFVLRLVFRPPRSPQAAVGRRRLLYGLAWLGVAYTTWTPGVLGMAWFVLMGFSCGSFVLTYAGAKEVVVPALSGMAIALVNTGIFLGAAILQPLFGWIMDLTWDGSMANGVRLYGSADYQAGFFLMLGCVALSIVTSTFFHETRCRNITVGE